MTRESGGSLCAASISDQETIDIVTNNQMATQEYQVRNLTLLNEQEVFLNEIEENWHCLPRSGSDQKALVDKMLDLSLYSKLAEYVLLQENSQVSTRFQFTEKGALKNALDLRLQAQLTDRLSQILQALNHYSSKGNILDNGAEVEKRAILFKIREEQEFVNGIETVYRALLQMQTIISLSIQGELQTSQM